MVIGLLSVMHGSWRPWPHSEVASPLGKSSPSLHIPVRGPDADETRIDGTLFPGGSWHYPTFPSTPRVPFSDSYLPLATPNTWPTVIGALVPRPFAHALHPFCQNGYAPKRQTLSGTFEMTLLRGQTALPPHAPYLRAFSASFPAMWILVKTS